MPQNYLVLLFTCAVLSFPPSVGNAETFLLPVGGDTVVGKLQHASSRAEETLVDMAREFDLGYDQIVKANPTVNRWLPGQDTKVVLPHRYILPGEQRKGIVLNIAELRLYYYPTPDKGSAGTVITYPVSIGRMDWKTPLGATKVVRKERDPAWHPTKSIREEHARDGDPLPEVIAGGTPENPLGRFALRLGFPGYLIHGVDERKTYGIGMRVTHGCIRMYPEDVENLFGIVPVNTPVFLMNEPIKLGWSGDRLLLEVHQPLAEDEDDSAPELPRVSTEDVTRYIRERVGDIPFDSDLVEEMTEEGDGIPREIAQSHSRVTEREIQPAQEAPAIADCIGGECGRPPTEKTTLDSDYQKAISQYLDRRDTTSVPSEVRREGEMARRPIPVSPNRGIDARRSIEQRY